MQKLTNRPGDEQIYTKSPERWKTHAFRSDVHAKKLGFSTF